MMTIRGVEWEAPLRAGSVAKVAHAAATVPSAEQIEAFETALLSEAETPLSAPPRSTVTPESAETGTSQPKVSASREPAASPIQAKHGDERPAEDDFDSRRVCPSTTACLTLDHGVFENVPVQHAVALRPTAPHQESCAMNPVSEIARGEAPHPGVVAPSTSQPQSQPLQQEPSLETFLAALNIPLPDPTAPATPETLRQTLAELFETQAAFAESAATLQAAFAPLLATPAAAPSVDSAEAAPIAAAETLLRPAELPTATPETLRQTLAELSETQAAFAESAATLQAAFAPLLTTPATAPSVDSAEAAPIAAAETLSRPAELPAATPETLRQTLVELSATQTAFAESAATLQAAFAPLLATPTAAPSADSAEAAPIAAAETLSRPAELPAATPETLRQTLAELSATQAAFAESAATLQAAFAPILEKAPAQEPLKTLYVATDDGVGEAEAPVARAEAMVAAMSGLTPAPAASSAASVSVPQPMVSAEAATRAALAPALKEAVEAVAQMVQVTPGLTRGEGEVRLRLRPTVLDGSEVRLLFREGLMTVQVDPASEPVRQLLLQQQAALTQALSERLPTFRVAVTLAGRDPEARKTKREND